MRTSRIGWIVVLLFIAGGAAFWIFLPELWIGQIWVGIAVLVAIALAFLNRRYDSAGAYQAWANTPGAQMMTGGMPAQQAAGGMPVQVFPGSEVGAAVLAALKQNGIDPTAGGTVDLRNAGAAREAVLTALRTHGIDVAHQIAGVAPSIPIQASSAPGDAIAKLQQLRDSGVISAQEFEQYRRGVSGGF